MAVGVAILMGPDVAPTGTVAVARPAFTTLKVVAGVPLKAMAVAPVKLLPSIVTLVPTGPDAGLKDVMAGPPATVTSYMRLDAAVPRGVVTEM